MNKHFRDSLYYLKRAGEHASLGVRETVEPVVDRARERLGRESETDPEPSRIETVRDEVATLERSASRRVRGVVGTARERVRDGRREDSAADR